MKRDLLFLNIYTHTSVTYTSSSKVECKLFQPCCKWCAYFNVTAWNRKYIRTEHRTLTLRDIKCVDNTSFMLELTIIIW